MNDNAREFITELFRTHYNGVGLKFTSPVKSVSIILRMGGRCFQFVLQNGTTVEPSLKYCFQSKPDNTAIAKKCFRDITWPFCLAYRENYFGPRFEAPCELTGVMTTRQNCEVDHVHPHTFERLLAERAPGFVVRASRERRESRVSAKDAWDRSLWLHERGWYRE